MIIPSKHISPAIAASSPDGFTFVESVHYEFPFLCSDEPREERLVKEKEVSGKGDGACVRGSQVVCHMGAGAGAID